MKSNENGFTLIEVMVVILIIGVLLSISIPNLANAGEKAHEKGCEANQRLIRTQLENYKLETGNYPSGENADVIFQELIDSKLLKKEPECPGGGTYVFWKASNTPISGASDLANDVTCTIHGQLGHE